MHARLKHEQDDGHERACLCQTYSSHSGPARVGALESDLLLEIKAADGERAANWADSAGELCALNDKYTGELETRLANENGCGSSDDDDCGGAGGSVQERDLLLEIMTGLLPSSKKRARASPMVEQQIAVVES